MRGVRFRYCIVRFCIFTAYENTVPIAFCYPVSVVRGLKGPWLKVRYTKNGVLKNGYIWQGLVSCMPLRRGDLKFIYAIERRADSLRKDETRDKVIEFFVVQLKVICMERNKRDHHTGR